MVDLSIIVPVYNTEKYLEQCLESLIRQNALNIEIEIIVINDGSTDNSKQILDQYQKTYPDIIKVYNQVNAGLSEARNTGIRHAQGQYIGFVDSDDYVNQDMFRLLYEKIKQADFDIVVSDIVYTFTDRQVQISSQVKEDIIDKDKIKASMLTIYPTVWNKLFKKELFEKDVLFTKGVWFEDCDFLYRLYPYINKIGVVPEACYYYRQREDAITYTYDSRLYQLVTNFDNIIEYYQKHNFYEKYRNELEYLLVRYSYGTMLKRLAKTKNYEEYKKGFVFAKNNIKKLFPQYRKNAYFFHQGLKGYFLWLFNGVLAKLLYYKEKNTENNL
ncbi:glycosyltransferase family 2 protein [Scatolibacter rhodanostii]|uniref:glycosyltransferase family 2 protein n=1 Tax=Scatolibacter rhodanostii TaxID=2014781 RepID=UPI000C06B03C|nr:glycosyltransferase family 2 protein [Scatolibacter rhodanostii]